MIRPHGGKLVNRIFRNVNIEGFSEDQKIVLSEGIVDDVKNIARGVYSPLEGFLCKDDFENVLKDMKLTTDVTWPIPIVLDVDKHMEKDFKEGDDILLLDSSLRPVGVLHLEDIYSYDKAIFAKSVFGTLDKSHVGVNKVFQMGDVLLGGKISVVNNSKGPFSDYILEPRETRALFRKKGWKTIAAFQTRNPPHRGHEYIQKCSLEIVDGLFINPVVGRKKPGDFTDKIILKSYKKLIENYYPKERVILGALPMQMRYAGPKEAIFHAIIRKNFGCTHFIVGRDHAGVGNFYDPYDAHKIFDKFSDLDIVPLKFDNAYYCKKCKSITTIKTCVHEPIHRIYPSGTFIRKLISERKPIPQEIMRPEVSRILLIEKDIYVKSHV